MILELHYRIVGLYQYAPVNKIVDDVFASGAFTPIMQKVNDRSYPVLPPTEYTFYMIHHMLKHYLYSGFGIRLLCDFSFYLDAITQTLTLQKFIHGAKNQKSCTYMKSFWKHAASILVCQKRLIPKSL